MILIKMSSRLIIYISDIENIFEIDNFDDDFIIVIVIQDHDGNNINGNYVGGVHNLLCCTCNTDANSSCDKNSVDDEDNPPLLLSSSEDDVDDDDEDVFISNGYVLPKWIPFPNGFDKALDYIIVKNIWHSVPYQEAPLAPSTTSDCLTTLEHFQ